MTHIDFEVLDRKLRHRLIRINRLKAVVRCLTVVVYSATLCWFVYCTLVAFFGWQFVTEQTADTWIYVMIGFGVFCVLHFSFVYCLTVLKDKEFRIMRDAIKQMFPEAACYANKKIPRRMVSDSGLFEVFRADVNPDAWTTCYGCIEFRGDGNNTLIYDIGVTSDKHARIMERIPVLGAVMMLYRSIVRPIFGTPVESAQHGFRGMFGSHANTHSCRGSVILLPDHLESKIGYLAHSIQSYRSKNGARHVMLEDPEFENLFAVYADDEVEARKILTPAMMRRITDLRKAFGKDLMISFSGEMLYYAVPIQGGFLRPSRESLKDRGIFEQIFHETNLGRNIPKELA